ncbi:MAG TPA: methyltransferase domain-containing protein [Longimicrobiales bacterium]|nr:methyltransferase domain-containing protein [Longimicrobiales bacterium]
MKPFELVIDAIAAGGAGVGRAPDGRAVFVHRTAPGERVRVRMVEERGRWARAELLQVIEPAPSRRDAPCPFYKRCGGCTLEHMEYAAQLEAKRRIVHDALTRIGGIDVQVPEVTPSPKEFRYRNRVSFSLVRTRDRGVLAGFHELLRPDRIVDMDESCLLPEEAVADAWGALRRNWGPDANRLPSGVKLRLTLRASAHGRTALLVQGGYSEGRAEELLPRVPSLDAVWHQPHADRPAKLLAGTAELAESWQDEDLALGGAVFLPVNREAAVLLEDHVMALAGDVAGLSVVDAYCGVGLHARRLARQGASVVGIELDAQAVREAERATPGGRFIAARVEDALPEALPADLVIVNPPRAGLDAGVVNALRTSPPQRIVYISCDPATLARDLKRLAPLFEVHSIRCFDLFPQTAHVESVAELTCSIT